MPPTSTLLTLLLLLEVVAIVLTLLAERILNYEVGIGFSEKGPITWLSFLQLLVIAALTLSILYLRKHDLQLKFWQAPAIVWAVIGLGFMALAFDEKFLVHENIDFYIHRILDLSETGWTDKIDDFLIGVYGLVGIGTVYVYRQELKKYRHAMPLLIIGFVLLFTTISLDASTNGATFIPRALGPWVRVCEESFKIFSEGMFMGFAYSCLTFLMRERAGLESANIPLRALKVKKSG